MCSHVCYLAGLRAARVVHYLTVKSSSGHVLLSLKHGGLVLRFDMAEKESEFSGLSVCKGLSYTMCLVITSCVRLIMCP